MDKVYILFNADENRILAVSKDKSLIEELMYDEFLRDCYSDFCNYMYRGWETYFPNLKDITNIQKITQEIWNGMNEYYSDYVYIFEEEVI